MMFTFLAAAAVSPVLSLRPASTASVRHGNVAKLRDLARTVSWEAPASLDAIAGLVDSIMLEEGNATEHLTAADQALLQEVIEMINDSMYASMTSAHNLDKTALQDAIDAINACYADFTVRVSEEGDIHSLHLSAVNYQNQLNDLQDVVDEKTLANATAWSNLENHMSLISPAPDCADFPNPRTMGSLDVYFADSLYVTWWTAQQAAYYPVRDAYLEAHYQLEEALQAYAVGLGVRDVGYCFWKFELEVACAAFGACYEARKAHYLRVVVPGVDDRMHSRINVYKAGETIIHQIKFLLAEEVNQATPAINTARYQIAFLGVPPKPNCDMSALHDAMWVPTPECPDAPTTAAPTPFCYQIVTGVGTHNDGTLSAQVSAGTLVVQAASGELFSKGDAVNSGCFADPITSIKVVNPTTNAWAGSIEYSEDGGDTFSNMICSDNCNVHGSADQFVVDGNGDSGNQASITCLNGQECTLTPALHTPFCYQIVTGVGNHNDGTLSAQVFHGVFVTQAASGEMFSKGDNVNFGCFEDPIASIKVVNPTTNAWAGSVEYSTDGGDTFSNMVCSVNCNEHGSADQFVVDGNSDGNTLASITCLNGQECTLTPQPAGSFCAFGGNTNDEALATSKAKAFIGLNPRLGTGSGFFKLQADFRADIWGTAPTTNGREPRTRNDLCTCDCNGSPDGVGCTGWAGIAFRSLSLLRWDCKRSEWRGQMMANDCNAALGTCDENSSWFEFFGQDIRESPGGAVVYSVATAPSTSNGVLGGVFRQANSPVSCKAAIQDEIDFGAGNRDGAASCFFRCGSEGQYSAWLDYCKQATDTSAATGYSGWGV